MKYIIELNKTLQEEDLEKDECSIASLNLQDKMGKDATSNNKVTLSISRNGLIGLGKELIRYAYTVKKSGHHWHLNPVKLNEGIVQTLGIFLTPQSPEVVIGFSGQQDLGCTSIKTLEAKADKPFYEITIPKTIGQLEDYQLDDDNWAYFQVIGPNNNIINNNIGYIVVYLNNNAMLCFGSKLIRLAHNFKEGKEVHISPASKENGAQQGRGIYLTPDSCELIIKCHSFQPIDTLLDEYKKEQKS